MFPVVHSFSCFQTPQKKSKAAKGQAVQRDAVPTGDTASGEPKKLNRREKRKLLQVSHHSVKHFDFANWGRDSEESRADFASRKDERSLRRRRRRKRRKDWQQPNWRYDLYEGCTTIHVCASTVSYMFHSFQEEAKAQESGSDEDDDSEDDHDGKGAKGQGYD